MNDHKLQKSTSYSSKKNIHNNNYSTIKYDKCSNKKENIKKKIASQFKKSHVVIFGAKKAYGGGRTRCFAMVYDSEDSMKKYEPKRRLLRIEREKLAPKDRKVEKKKEGRKVFKVKKHQKQKKRGTARRQQINLDRKQKKKK